MQVSSKDTCKHSFETVNDKCYVPVKSDETGSMLIGYAKYAKVCNARACHKMVSGNILSLV